MHPAGRGLGDDDATELQLLLRLLATLATVSLAAIEGLVAGI